MKGNVLYSIQLQRGDEKDKALGENRQKLYMVWYMSADFGQKLNAIMLLV